MNCGFDSQHGQCPDQCDNRRWKFASVALDPVDPQYWTLDDSITVSSGEIFCNLLIQLLSKKVLHLLSVYSNNIFFL